LSSWASFRFRRQKNPSYITATTLIMTVWYYSWSKKES
jgi:hypothetical protein